MLSKGKLGVFTMIWNGGTHTVRQARTAAMGMVLVLAVGLAPSVQAAASLQQVQQQEQQTMADLQHAQAQYTQDLNAWSAARTHLLRVNAELQGAAQRLAQLTTELRTAEGQLQQLASQVVAAQRVVAADQAKANSGLVLLDEGGQSSFITVLMGATSFADFLTRATYLERIWRMEISYLGAAQAAKAHLQDLERQQQAVVGQLQALNRQADATVAQLRAYEAQASQAQIADHLLVAHANAIVVQLAAQKNSLEQEIRKILAALESGKVPWSVILAEIQTLARQYGISPLLVEAVVLQESGGSNTAKSSVGAEGLMQLMPGTAAGLGVSNLYDPIQNLKGGITYLLEQLQRFNGNLALALAAYNAGPYAVEKYGGIPPYAQTQNYVKSVLALYNSGR